MALWEVSTFMHVLATNALHGATQVAQRLAWPKRCLYAPDHVVNSNSLALRTAVSCSVLCSCYMSNVSTPSCDVVIRRLWR